MSRASLAALTVVLLVVAGAAAYMALGGGGSATTTMSTSGGERQIIVCNAGSLLLSFKQLSSSFTGDTSIEVLLKPSGSVDIVRKVTELGVRCDVVAVADYRLIPMYLYPNYTDWYLVFAANSMVIAWRPGAEGLGGNLSAILSEMESDKATYGFSDPNRDPCGYRAVGVIGLLALERGDMGLLERLVIERIPGSSYEIVNGTLHIYIPASFTPRENLVVRPKSIELLSLLESGELDYAILYKSEAVAHNLSYIELPSYANLGDLHLASKYSRVVVHILAGSPEEREIPMAPIAYGITVTRDSSSKADAVTFVRYLIEHGARVFEPKGFKFFKKPLGYGSLPEELAGLATVEG